METAVYQDYVLSGDNARHQDCHLVASGSSTRVLFPVSITNNSLASITVVCSDASNASFNTVVGAGATVEVSTGALDVVGQGAYTNMTVNISPP